METVNLPRPIRILWGSLGAWSIASIINPGFKSIAIMLLFFIPVLISELYFANQKEEISSPLAQNSEQSETKADNSESEDTA